MKFATLLKQNTAATSAAIINLTTAADGFFTLAQAIAAGELEVGDQTTCLVSDSAGNKEFSLFEITDADTITRVEVRRSTNNDQAETFPNGAVVTNMPDAAFLSQLLSVLESFDLGSAEMVNSFETGDTVPIIRGGTVLRALVSAVQGNVQAPPDTTGPTLSSPSGTATGATTANGSVTTNEAGGTLYSLFTTSSTATAAAVKAGASKTVTASGAQSVSGTGLTAATTHYAHFLHRDASGNDSTVASTAPFTTSAAADTTAPTLSSPSGTQTGQTTASGSVSTNEANGTLYRCVSANATESAATVKAANLTSAVSATGVQSVAFTGLTAGTTYYPHYLHRDAAGNESTVANGAAFTTATAMPQSDRDKYTATAAPAPPFSAFPTTKVSDGGYDSTNRYFAIDIKVSIKAADNSYPASGAVKCAWIYSADGSVPTSLPAALAFTGGQWPDSVPYNANGGTAPNGTNVPNSVKTLVYFNDTDPYKGIFSLSASLFGGGAVGGSSKYFPAVLYPDGTFDIVPSGVAVS